MNFDRFVAIDWSGAKGARQKGIAVGFCERGERPPALLHRGEDWSRTAVLEWLREIAAGPQRTLVGLDLGISLPFADCGAFFPGHAGSPDTAKDLWTLVEEICSDEPNLGANSFIDDPRFAPYFRRHGGREGGSFRCDNAEHGRGRFRVTEREQERQGCKPYSNFNLVGAAQVGKSSLTGMRVLHRLQEDMAIWPVDPLPHGGSVVVEIYTTIAAMAAGRSASRAKMRWHEDVDLALRELGSEPTGRTGPIDDHSADALVSAAWLRRASRERELWAPAGMTADVAKTEGWTFGVACSDSWSSTRSPG